MSTDPVVAPYTPPDVAQPPRAQRQALQALSERLRSLLPAALGVAGVTCVMVREPDPDAAPVPLDEGGWAVVADWSHGAAWRLLLSAGAATALLAVQLGQDELLDHPLSDLDLRLLQTPLRALADALGQALGAAGGLFAPVLRQAPVAADAAPVVAWRVRLEHPAGAGEAVLAATWASLREALVPPDGTARLERHQLDGAPVTVEATLSGPELSARELLGMQPGDILTMGTGDELSLLAANGVAFARGRMGAKGGRLALNIQQVAPLKEE